MDLNRLRYFYNVAKYGSFSRAAAEVHISQPSLSKMVKILEEDLGQTLFTRSKHGVKLTSAGQFVFEKCQNIFSEADSIQSGVLEINHDIVGNLKVGASDNLCNYLLPSIFNEITNKFPKVKVSLFSGSSKEILGEITDDKVEIGIFYTDVKHLKGFAIAPVCFIEFYIVSKAKLKLSDLNNVPYAGSRKTDYKTAYPALDMLNRMGISPKICFETNNQETQKKMALTGEYYTVVPKHMVEAEIINGQLQRVALPQNIGTMVSIVYKKNKSLSKQTELFQRILKSRFRT